MVICIRTKEGENQNSFASNGTAYSLNNNAIVVVEKDGFDVLTESGRERMINPIQDIIGTKKTE